MKLFLISQSTNNNYDTYDAAVVVAPDEQTAITLHPRTGKTFDFKERQWEWVNCIDDINVEYIGEASPELKQGVVCASFNAG